MFNLISAMTVLILGFSAMAAEAGAPKSHFYSGPEMVERYWMIACGPKNQIPKNPEIAETRSKFQNFLKNPRLEAASWLAAEHLQNNQTRQAEFNLVLMCGSVQKFEERLQTEKCLNDNNRRIDAREAISYCETYSTASKL